MYEVKGIRFDTYSVESDEFFSMATPQIILRDYFCTLMQNTKNQLIQISKQIGIIYRNSDDSLKSKAEIAATLREVLPFTR